MTHLSGISFMWRKLPRPVRVGIAAFAVLAGFNIVVALANIATTSGAVGGPRGSSYSTAASGTAGLFELLSDQGFDTVRSRRSPAAEPPDSEVMMVLDPEEISEPDSRALRRFVEGGGRLILGGDLRDETLTIILDSAPEWSSEGPRTSRPVIPLAEVANIGSVEGEGSGWWSGAGNGAPLLAGEGQPTVLAADVGSGRILLLADTSPLQNEWLGSSDAAAFALALAGEPGHTVVFAEAFHGYAAEGLAAVPLGWRWMLAALSGATLLLMWNRSRRLGPRGGGAEPPLPARIAYVEALTSSVATAAGRTSTVGGLQRRGRSVVASRLGIPADANEAAFRRGTDRAGIERSITEALWARPSNDAEVLTVGRELAAIHRGEI